MWFSIKGDVSGIGGADHVTVSVGTAVADTFLETRTVTASAAHFLVDGLNASRAHFLKLEGAGYVGEPSSVVEARDGASVDGACVVTAALTATAVANGSDVFEYHWESDASRAGAATARYVVAPPEIVFENETVTLGADQAAGTLYQMYGVVLDDGGEPWTSEYAARLLITLEAPEPISSRGHHVPMPWWQHSVLVNTALVEDGETRLRRDRMRASSSNTTADSYWHGHLHSAYV